MNSKLIFIIEIHVKQIKNDFESIKLLILLEEEISFISSLCWSYPQCFCQLLYEKTLRNQLFFGLKVNANDFSLKPMTLIRVLQPHHEPACVRLYLFSDIIVKKDFKVAEKRKCKHFHTHVSVCWQMVLYCDSTRFI